MTIKVLIADDNSFIREGMKIILSSFEEFEVAGTVEDGAEAVAFCKGHDVDVALLDVRMPNMNGVEAARLLTEQTKVKPLILTTFDDDEFVLEAIRAGARGYLLKNNDPERIRDAIKSVCNDHHVLQDVVLDKIKANLAAYHPSSPDAAMPDSGGTTSPPAADPGGCKIDRSPFTERELGVMDHIARGLSNKEIAKKLFISEGTVANYITSILNKTGLEHRTQIAIYYLTGEARTSDE
ncbi:response regulator transcription factor [Paenibacillus melissococcoides]|uniref:Response regulator transcription factor n=1 Tax=Paenibacillus melissococcoides TaxID=2912268 RepID=A0ABN8UAU8_9BACL|nr:MULTISPECIES: response regulator transcription factor [Paenibacillus]MEB9892464.1 response regulator transcription factor [Bacillus cereus]CAH8248263.1 response regulator transcription factor [Paenibacillus melissococcoides]CAH8718005.1 response regulator transcription factor [Paenibacillus melissococcoides]CAH8719116.1 response regulator transcription factor [Paenibacillus melissococcoides]GIO78654.1 DNA-binding response regulator [Paenibacillus dendritiformis]